MPSKLYILLQYTLNQNNNEGKLTQYKVDNILAVEPDGNCFQEKVTNYEDTNKVYTN